MSEGPCILLLAGDVRGNMGDRAIRAALCALVRRHYPQASLFIVSKTPERDAREFGATVLGRNPWALVRRFRDVRRCDLAIWGGGQLLQDDSSRVKNPYWALILAWVRRAAGVRILGASLGIGPLTTRWGRCWARIALRQLDHLIARDERSARLARDVCGERFSVEVAPDLAWFLPPLQTPAPSTETRTELRVGIAVRRWFHLGRRWLPYAWRRPASGAQENERFDQFLRNLAAALAEVGRAHALTLQFFPMASAAWESDAELSDRVGRLSGLPYEVLRLDGEAIDTRARLGGCDLLLSVRMHPALLALSQAVPTAAFHHVDKVRDLMESLGLGEQCLPLAAASAPDAVPAIRALVEQTIARRAELRARLCATLPALWQQEEIYTAALSRIMERKGRALPRAARETP